METNQLLRFSKYAIWSASGASGSTGATKGAPLQAHLHLLAQTLRAPQEMV
ncbi:hypothetical protein Stsp01_66590 [Streptomyces sp. NBRC 13847]|nr:hypothetical protein Stsp01_66590 [Streptomyces sp. NBRC 13847]